jgi:hypothetical protein
MILEFLGFGFRQYNGAKLAREGRSSDFWNKKSAVEFSASERTQSTPV